MAAFTDAEIAYLRSQPLMRFATVGAATMYGAIKVKQRYHPAPFNPSIKELYEWVVKKNGDA